MQFSWIILHDDANVLQKDECFKSLEAYTGKYDELDFQS